jgi:hypothetical protein
MLLTSMRSGKQGQPAVGCAANADENFSTHPEVLRGKDTTLCDAGVGLGQEGWLLGGGHQLPRNRLTCTLGALIWIGGRNSSRQAGGHAGNPVHFQCHHVPPVTGCLTLGFLTFQ